MATQTKYSFADLYGFNLKAGFDAVNAGILAAIGLAESGGNALAHNQHGPTATSQAENSVGVYQINLLAHNNISMAAAQDPQQAADYAYQLYRSAGNTFSDWSTFTSGAYQQFLTPGLSNPISGIASGAGNAIGGATNAVAQATVNAWLSGIADIPVIGKLVTAPADLFTRIGGVIIGSTMVLIGIVVVGVSAQRKVVDAVLSPAEQQGIATGASIAATDGGSEPEMTSVPRTIPNRSSESPQRAVEAPETIKSRPRVNRSVSPPPKTVRRSPIKRLPPSRSVAKSKQVINPVDAEYRDVNAPQLRPGGPERMQRARKAAYERGMFPRHYNPNGTLKKKDS